jgi:DNA mismatch repair protein MutS
VTRAAAVLAALEERARGLDPLAGEMPLFARAAPPPAPVPEPAGGTEEPDPLRAALEDIDPDTLTPRAALEAVYRLKAMLR